MIEFFNIDKYIFEMVDDSSGHVGDIFRYDALELFSTFAKEVSNKTELINSIVELNQDDGYGVRDCLISEAFYFLNTDELRQLYDAVKNDSKRDKNKCSWDWKLPVIAKQMKDAPLFEKLTREQLGDRIHSRSLVEIAEVYYLSGDYQKAQSILNQVSKEDDFSSHERNDLQKKLFKVTNKTDDLKEALEKEFYDYYSERSLEELLTVVGADKKQEYCKKATNDIVNRRRWNSSDVKFLIYCEELKAVERLVLECANSIDGDSYYSLVNIAEVLESHNFYLAASILYRALLNSILRRAKSKTYHHGVRYLKKSEQLANKISNWQGFHKHEEYFADIKKNHARKSAFWS